MATKHIRRESNNKVPTSTTPYPDTPEMRKAFQQLKDALSTAPVLIHPDFNRGFTLYTDACRKGIAGALHQISADDKKEHPVLFISRTLKPAEKNYSSTEIECLAIVWCLHKLEHYVDGARLTLYTDHSALKWIWDMKSTVNARLFKWSLLLNPLRHKVTIVHRPGRFHNNVDPLSRNPISNSVTLSYLDESWIDRLWLGYQNDAYFRRILNQLLKLKPGMPEYITNKKKEEEIGNQGGSNPRMKGGALEDGKDGHQGGKLDSLIKGNSALNEMEIGNQGGSNPRMKGGALEDGKIGHQGGTLDSPIKSNGDLENEMEIGNQGDSNPRMKGGVLNNRGEEAEAMRIEY
jgi:hypothetical protein